MKKFTAQDVESIYEQMVVKATKSFKKKRFFIAYRYIKAAAKWAYGFNFIFCDRRLENMIHSMGAEMIRKKCVNNNNEERFVLLDTCSEDNRGLHQQYLRAFEKLGISYLFITLRKDIAPLKRTIEEISSYSKGMAWHYDAAEGNPYKKADIISDVIYNYSPNRIFLHLMPSDIVSLMAIDAIAGPKKYNINLTDHAFWLGASFVDYNIEFRGCGRTISLEKRGFNGSQLINLPFYPIIQKNNINDLLPARENGDVIVFTGGAPYKMVGNDNYFFKIIIDGILSISHSVKVWVAGFNVGDKLLENILEGMKNRDRIINIGVRKDINNVFEHCDVYLGTYPMGGGLMSQYAAINGKPILSFSDSNTPVVFNVDSIVNQCSEAMHSFFNIDEFLNYARQLVFDKDFRELEGNHNKTAIMSEDKFNKSFQSALLDNTPIVTWKDEVIDYDKIIKSYLDFDNEGSHNNVVEIISVLKFSSLILLWKYLPIVIPVFWRLAKKYSFNLKQT